MGFLGGSKADSKENRLENNRARRKMRLTGLFFVRRSSSDLSKGYRLLAIILHRCPDPARTIRIRKRLALSEPTLIVSRCDFDAGPLGSYVDGISLRRTSIEESELLLRDTEQGCVPSWMLRKKGHFFLVRLLPDAKISRPWWCRRVTIRRHERFVITSR